MNSLLIKQETLLELLQDPSKSITLITFSMWLKGLTLTMMKQMIRRIQKHLMTRMIMKKLLFIREFQNQKFQLFHQPH